jgi:hypothetical protein
MAKWSHEELKVDLVYLQVRDGKITHDKQRIVGGRFAFKMNTPVAGLKLSENAILKGIQLMGDGEVFQDGTVIYAINHSGMRLEIHDGDIEAIELEVEAPVELEVTVHAQKYADENNIDISGLTGKVSLADVKALAA